MVLSQITDHVADTGRWPGIGSAAGAASSARGRMRGALMCAGQLAVQGGQLRQDLVLADVCVLRPGGIGPDGAGVAVAAPVGGLAVRAVPVPVRNTRSLIPWQPLGSAGGAPPALRRGTPHKVTPVLEPHGVVRLGPAGGRQALPQRPCSPGAAGQGQWPPPGHGRKRGAPGSMSRTPSQLPPLKRRRGSTRCLEPARTAVKTGGATGCTARVPAPNRRRLSPRNTFRAAQQFLAVLARN